jgi:transcriptional regulatory protein LevR
VGDFGVSVKLAGVKYDGIGKLLSPQGAEQLMRLFLGPVIINYFSQL